MAVLPNVATNMDSLGIAYFFDSLKHFADTVDGVGMTPAFQKIVTKTSELGTLKNSRPPVAINWNWT